MRTRALRGGGGFSSSAEDATRAIEPISIGEIRAARRRIAGSALRTPLLRLNAEQGAAEIWLKLENLQPIGSFKLRGAGNAMAIAPPGTLARGVYTASAGNMAQGVAWNARRLGIPCSVVVPDRAPKSKLDAIERLGGRVVRVPFDRWWQIIVEHQYPGMEGLFIHPFSDPAVIAGNGTIGLEILEELPDVNAIVVPWGGGGLACGIASATRAVSPAARVFACEVETAAPFSASLANGAPKTVLYTPSFVDGIGGKSVLPEMWSLASSLLDGSLVVSLSSVAAAIRLLVERNHVVAEGAGAASVAAALNLGGTVSDSPSLHPGTPKGGKIVCVVSGGNIDPGKLAAILSGTVPAPF